MSLAEIPMTTMAAMSWPAPGDLLFAARDGELYWRIATDGQDHELPCPGAGWTLLGPNKTGVEDGTTYCFRKLEGPTLKT